METQLSEMLDAHRIAQVCFRYGLALDTQDWAQLATCFESDAVAVYPGIADEVVGYDAIETVCRNALTPLTRSQHLMGNVLPILNGGEARVTTYLQAQHVLEGAPSGANFIIAGCYRDRFVKRSDEWRIARRELEVWWTEGNPAVVGPLA